MVSSQFWKGRKVFLTGHTGFKGGWLALWLQDMGAEVQGYALAPFGDGALFDALRLGDSMMSTLADIRDHARLSAEMSSFAPEIVFHLAAQPLVRYSYAEPRLTYETNVIGTLNVYEAVRACQTVRAVVSITTDKCYENREWIWGYRETDPMGGYDPYSSSKGCAELLSSAYRSSYFNSAEYGKSHHLGLATARAGNVIGGGDWSLDRLVPDCIRALRNSETIQIRSPRSTRPWQHVLEPLHGYLALAERLHADGPSFAEGWNFGPGDDGVMNVENVVRRVISAWGAGRYALTQDASLHEAQLLKLDASKARAVLGWRPVFDVGLAIEETVAWYRANEECGDMREFTVAQIRSYVEKLLQRDEGRE